VSNLDPPEAGDEQPVPPAPGATQAPLPGASISGTDAGQKQQTIAARHLLQYAEWYALGALAVSIIVWLSFMPWRQSSRYAPPPETELCIKIVEAQIADNPSTSNQQLFLPPGCPKIHIVNGNLTVSSVVTPVRWMPSMNLAVSVPTGIRSASVNELMADLNIWTRYEYELKTFEWGRDLNWYIYSSLRVLVVILSAITPALIVAPIFEKKKFLAALPAAIVAIGTGCITEFDFKLEAAAYTLATVQIQGEKTGFITRFRPIYYYSGALPIGQSRSETLTGDKIQASAQINNEPFLKLAVAEMTSPASLASLTVQHSATKAIATSNSLASKDDQNQQSGSTKGECAEDNVPFVSPENYAQIRANFACRIQVIWQKQMSERLIFLRGQQSQPGAIEQKQSQPGSGGPQSQQGKKK
jgi:hypothetical protein